MPTVQRTGKGTSAEEPEGGGAAAGLPEQAGELGARDKRKVIEQTEKAMQYSEVGCAACSGKGYIYRYGEEKSRDCGVCSGLGVVRFKRKGLKLEPVSEIIEGHPLMKEDPFFDESLGVPFKVEEE